MKRFKVKMAIITSILMFLAIILVQFSYAESLTGNLIYASSQRPVSDARVMITDDQGKPVFHTTTNGKGDFSLAGIEPGVYRIVVFSSTRGTQILTEQISVVPGKTTELNFEVGPRKTLWGQAPRYKFM